MKIWDQIKAAFQKVFSRKEQQALVAGKEPTEITSSQKPNGIREQYRKGKIPTIEGAIEAREALAKEEIELRKEIHGIIKGVFDAIISKDPEAQDYKKVLDAHFDAESPYSAYHTELDFGESTSNAILYAETQTMYDQIHTVLQGLLTGTRVALSKLYEDAEKAEKREAYMRVVDAKEREELAVLTPEEIDERKGKNPYNPANKEKILNEVINGEMRGFAFAMKQPYGQYRIQRNLEEGVTLPTFEEMYQKCMGVAVDLASLEAKLSPTVAKKLGIQYSIVKATGKDYELPEELQGKFASTESYIADTCQRGNNLLVDTMTGIGIKDENLQSVYSNVVQTIIENRPVLTAQNTQKMIQELVDAEIGSGKISAVNRDRMTEALQAYIDGIREFPLQEKGIQHNQFLVYDGASYHVVEGQRRKEPLTHGKEEQTPQLPE